MALSRSTGLKRGKPLERKSTLSGGGPIRKKQKTPEEKQQQSEDIEKMWALMEEHWNSKPHVCESCGDPIWGENKTLYHDHLLEKSVYEEYKYDIDNLFMCCWECHTKKGNGYPTEKHKVAIQTVRKRYGI